ncbi:unnamed protein product [Ectocarpus sp. 12 AP-2014]
MAAVPAGALALSHSYVERAAAQEVADGLTDPEEPRTPYTVVGMGGGGKSVLASAVVRKSSVRERFRGGIFWLRVGRGAKNSLLPLLQGLAREIGAARTDTPHGVPRVLDSLEQVKQHLGTVASTGTSRRLVVLDDVWEREVVDALLPLGLKVLVTTRYRSVVGVPTGCVEMGNMTEEEALELLLKTSRTVGLPGDAVRTQMTKVVARCGRLPLMLAIAGSMSVVEGRGLTAGAWEELIKLFENTATMMWESGLEATSLDVVLGASLSALAAKKRKEFLKMAVLAPGADAPIEMLRNLWETEDKKGAREEADGLTSKSLLQDVGGGGYRVHDLILGFVKIKIKADAEMMRKVTALQAHFLGRLDVLRGFYNPEHGPANQGLFVLDALWRSVEELSGNSKLEVASYSTSLGELESCDATTDVAFTYLYVGFLFNIQGKYVEAEPLYERCQTIEENALGLDHPSLASTLNNRARLLERQRKYEEAEPLYRSSLAIDEKVLGLNHPEVAAVLNDWAGRGCSASGKYAEAEPLYARCQAIEEKVLGLEHPSLAITFNNRAELLRSQGKYDDAEPLCVRAIAIGEKALGPEHPDLAVWLNNRAELLRVQGKYEEAEPLYGRATAIWEKALGADHPTVATVLNNWAGLLEKQGKYDDAEQLYERSLAIREKVLGPEHPDVAQSLNNRASLLQAQGKHAEAEPLYGRATVIWEKALGAYHLTVAIVLNNRAWLFKRCSGYFKQIMFLRSSRPDLCCNTTLPRCRPCSRGSTRKPTRCMSGHRPSERRCWAQSTLTWPHRSTTERSC